jgi:thiamine-phosphate pyrophosphorylase
MKLVFPRVYVIIDAALLRNSAVRASSLATPRALALSLADSGVELIQYRDKQSPSRAFLSLSQEIGATLRPLGVSFVVNDRADVAAAAGASGVHVGQEDLPVEEARRVVGPGHWVGVSTHNEGQVRAAAATSADYVAVGPVYPTATKNNPDPVTGLAFVRQARRLTGKPLVAIGGITLENAEGVFAAGADCVAVAGDILHAADPPARAREFLKLVANSKLGD